MTPITTPRRRRATAVAQLDLIAEMERQDAARLAVRRQIVVEVEHGEVWARPPGSYDGDPVGHDGTEPDKLRAYCEAVTLCAAAIGLRMREGGR